MAARGVGIGALAVLAAALMGGCVSAPPVPGEPVVRTASSLGWTQAPGGPLVSPQWWPELGDPALDALVEQALQGQPSLRVAQARVARARAVQAQAESASSVQAGLGLDLMRQRYTQTGPYPPPLAGSERSSATVNVGASWEIDFFGRNEAALQAALGAARAAQADADAARLVVSAQVVRAWIHLARLGDQKVAGEEAVVLRAAQLGLLRQRLEAGLDTLADERQALGTLAEARQQLHAVAEQIQLARHALAALAGLAPDAAAAWMPSLAALKLPALPAPLPVNTLGQRPDVAASRWRVEAASREVEVARTQFYPNVNLSAFVGLSSLTLSRLAEAGSLQWGVGPAIRLPLFEAPRLRAQLDARTAEQVAAVESYNGVLLDAVREVADQLAQRAALDQQLQEQRAVLAAAQAQQDLARQRFEGGLGGRLPWLAAQAGTLAQRRQGLDLQARALDAHAGLMRALGGGWFDNDPAPALADAIPRK